jgi:hypothetical protein
MGGLPFFWNSGLLLLANVAAQDIAPSYEVPPGIVPVYGIAHGCPTFLNKIQEVCGFL